MNSFDHETGTTSNNEQSQTESPSHAVKVDEALSEINPAITPIFPSEPLPPPEQPSLSHQVANVVWEVIETVVPAILIAVFFNLFLAQATRVYGQSMEPNLHTDQRLVVEKISYRLQVPERHDIIILRVHPDSEDLLIKRVIGLPGETVEVHEGKVFINNEPLDEPYLTQPTRGNYGPIVIPPLHVFVLGDNRGASNDSRSFGPIPYDNIIGRAWLSYWPLEEIGLVD
jgi:signal peptidase I